MSICVLYHHFSIYCLKWWRRKRCFIFFHCTLGAYQYWIRILRPQQIQSDSFSQFFFHSIPFSYKFSIHFCTFVGDGVVYNWNTKLEISLINWSAFRQCSNTKMQFQTNNRQKRDQLICYFSFLSFIWNAFLYLAVLSCLLCLLNITLREEAERKSAPSR